jgi:hypothetical protein
VLEVRTFYEPEKFEIRVFVHIYNFTIYNQTFDARNITNMRLFSEKLGDEIGKHAKEISDINTRTHSALLSVRPKNAPLKYKNIITGKCKYVSLGYIRYAYLGFALRYIHTPWVKVYFDRTNILYDKTFEQLKRDRSKQSFEGPNTPPSVFWLPEDMENCTKTYMKEKESKIFSMVNSLPLNKTGIREDQDFKAVIVVREGDELKNVEDLSDPNLDLYVLMFIDDNLHKKHQGFCRSFSGNLVYSVLSQDCTYSHKYSHIIGRTNSRCCFSGAVGMHADIYERVSRVSEPIEQDEFISLIMDELIKKWKEGMDAKST